MAPSAEADQCGGGSVAGTDPVQQATPASQRPGAGQLPDRLLHQGAQAGLVAVVGALSVGQPILGPPIPDRGMPVLVVCVRLSGRVSGRTVTGSSILSRSNDPVPVETRLQLVLAVLAHEMTVAEAARRHGVSAESINRWRNRFVDAGKAAMEDGMPGKAGSRGSLVERRQRAEIQELKLALAEATVQLRIWQKGSEYVDLVPSPTSRP